MDFRIEFLSRYPFFSKIILALFILIVTGLIEHFVVRVIKRLGCNDNVDLPSSSIFANIARVTIWLLGISILAKNCFHYDVSTFIAALGIGGIALSLGLKDTLANLFGGLQISLGRIVAPGDYFVVNDIPSLVTDVTWRYTMLKDQSGTTYIVPNSLMYTDMLIKAGDSGWVSVPVLLDPKSDIDAFTKEITQALQVPLDGILAKGGVSVQLKGIVVGGLSATISAEILRNQMSQAAATDLIMRSVDSVLKRYTNV